MRSDRPVADAPLDLAESTGEEAARDLLVIPVGSIEQHGAHLPLGTDTTIAAFVAHELCRRARGEGLSATLAPALAYGASGEHEGFAGTISIGTDALASVLTELGRSAGRWAARTVFVNGHGGNVEALARAVPLLRSEGRDCSWIACAPGSDVPTPDPHAGRHETALVLHLRPHEVRAERAERGETRPLADILPTLRARGVAAVSPNGVLGDPVGATAEEGARIAASICDRAWDALVAESIGADGRRLGTGAGHAP